MKIAKPILIVLSGICFFRIINASYDKRWLYHQPSYSSTQFTATNLNDPEQLQFVLKRLEQAIQEEESLAQLRRSLGNGLHTAPGIARTSTLGPHGYKGSHATPLYGYRITSSPSSFPEAYPFDGEPKRSNRIGFESDGMRQHTSLLYTDHAVSPCCCCCSGKGFAVVLVSCLLIAAGAVVARSKKLRKVLSGASSQDDPSLALQELLESTQTS
jgi:hypothetical protein